MAGNRFFKLNFSSFLLCRTANVASMNCCATLTAHRSKTLSNYTHRYAHLALAIKPQARSLVYIMSSLNKFCPMELFVQVCGAGILRNLLPKISILMYKDIIR